jgi:predicted enzyme related to lactoylglutathione lyase
MSQEDVEVVRNALTAYAERGLDTGGPTTSSRRTLQVEDQKKNGGTTMLKKVAYVALLVSDQDKALDFYTNVIGLERRGDYPTPDGPRFLTVGVKGQDFDLVLWPGTPGRANLGSAVYTIEVEDCRMAFETLKSRGVKFEPPDVLEFPWGYAARFQDPDGNLLQVREGRGE